MLINDRVMRIFNPRFFHKSNPLEPLINGLKAFRIFAKKFASTDDKIGIQGLNWTAEADLLANEHPLSFTVFFYYM
jgi:hypothetical protein